MKKKIMKKIDECQGIITLRDVRNAIAEYGLDALMKKVEDVMTRKLITIPPISTTSEAGAIMFGRKIDHLPVVDEKGVIEGIVASKDLLIPLGGRSLIVREIMTRELVTITPTGSVLEAVKLMYTKNVASLLVFKK